MTQKRFIKLVMSKGFDRNEANRYAQRANAAGIPYSAAFSGLMLEFYAADALVDGIRKLVKTASRAARGIAAGFAAFAEAYNRETGKE